MKCYINISTEMAPNLINLSFSLCSFDHLLVMEGPNLHHYRILDKKSYDQLETG